MVDAGRVYLKVSHLHNCATGSRPERAAGVPGEWARASGLRGAGRHRLAALFFLSGAAPGSVAH